MRLLPLLGLLLLAAPLQAQTISLSLDNATPASAIRALFEKAKRPFIYIDSSGFETRKITLTFENEPFDTALVRLLAAAKLSSSEREGLYTVKRPEENAYSLLKALHQMQVRFAYDPLKQEVVVMKDITGAGLQQLAKLSSTRFEIQTREDSYSLKIQASDSAGAYITADFRDTRLSVVAKTLGVAVEPVCENKQVTALLEKTPRQKALTLIAQLTKTKLVQRGDIQRFEPAE